MDLGELQDILEEETSYVPTSVDRSKRPSTIKPLQRQLSSKSIQQPINTSASPLPPPPEKRSTLLNLHKETAKKETISFEDFFKETPKPPVSMQNNSGGTQPRNRKDEFNILEEDQPVVASRRMKPPARRGDESKSVVSMAEFKRGNNLIEENKSGFDKVDNHSEDKKADHRGYSPKTFNNPTLLPKDNGNANRDDAEHIKNLMEAQSRLQKESLQKLLAQQRQSHKAELDKIRSLHKEELTKKLELKDFQILKLKEFNDLQSKLKSERNEEIRDISSMNRKISENIKMIEKLEKQQQETHKKSEDHLHGEKSRIVRAQEDYIKDKEEQIVAKMEDLAAREKDHKEEKYRHLSQIDSERRKIEEQERRVIKRQSQMEIKFRKRERQLEEQYQAKAKKLNESSIQTRQEQMQLEQERMAFLTQKEEHLITHKRKDDNYKLLIEEVQLQKTKVMNREIEFNSKINELSLKESEIDLREREAFNKLKLIELERKKINVEKDTRIKYVTEYGRGFKDHSAFSSKDLNDNSKLRSEASELPIYQKSIKELRDQYLRNLSQI